LALAASISGTTVSDARRDVGRDAASGARARHAEAAGPDDVASGKHAEPCKATWVDGEQHDDDDDDDDDEA